jgi:hypothetical protein
MSSQGDRLFAGLSYLPRVTQHDGLALEDALGGGTLFDEATTISGAVVEAAYAADGPPLLDRFRTDRVPTIYDCHSLRFAGEAFLGVARIAGLPFAPDAPVKPETFDDVQAEQLVRATFEFVQERGASAYTIPGLPLFDQDRDGWIEVNRRIAEAACRVNGAGDLERRPLIATIAPGRSAMNDPGIVLDWLLDLPVDGVHFLPTNFNAVRDSVEKLTRYVEYVDACATSHLGVLLGRSGAFAEVVHARVGRVAFDSGLGIAEAHVLSRQLRPTPSRREQRRGGAGKRLFLEPLMTTLRDKHAVPLLSDALIRGRLVCPHACCRFRGFEDLLDRRRPHYLRTKTEGARRLWSVPQGLRRTIVAERIQTARENARLAVRLLRHQGIEPPTFDHLERWAVILGDDAQLTLFKPQSTVSSGL